MGSRAAPVHPGTVTAPDAHRSPRELGARELGGYRVLRSLARDERAEVVLGHRTIPASSDCPVDVVQTVALKVSPSSDAGWHVALREVSALELARGEHVVDLLDLDADDDCIRLIFERLPRGDLAELLRVRSQFDAGEAVTLLAPIAVTLQRLHAAGVAHGNLSARTVLFRDDGSPTLIGFSGAQLFEADAPEVVLEQIEAVRRDRVAARGLATTVLARATGARGRAAHELLDDVASCDEELILPVLASRLFEVAAAVPLRFAPDEREADAAVAGPRAIPTGEALVGADVERGAESPVGTPTRMAAALGRVVPEALLQRLVDVAERSPVAPVADAAVRHWRSWTPTRRRIVLAVGAAALTVGVVTAVVPAGAPATGATGTTAASWPSGVPSGSASAFAESEQTVRDAAVTGDDPVAASGALLSARDRCLGSLSLRCLDQVDAADSGALKDDQSAIRAAQQGGELPDPLWGGADKDSAVLIERLGDSALVRLGDPSSGASILVVKGDAGWRIRDVVARVDSTG